MIHYHQSLLDWPFVPELKRALRKGWRKNSWCVEPQSNFYFSLHSDNLIHIQTKLEDNVDYYIVDTPYIGVQENRFPRLNKNSLETSYFRISKNGLHNDLSKISDDPTRFNQLLDKGIWYAKLINEYEEKEINERGHVLLTPSSELVCQYMSLKSQRQWIIEEALELKKYINKDINLRLKLDKFAKGEKYKPIQEVLKNVYILATNMSLSAIDAIVHGIPIICDKKHVCYSLSSTTKTIKSINKDDLYTWGCKVANCQFTLKEISQGVPNDYLG